MTEKKRKRFWPICRRVFCIFRILLLLLLLSAAFALLYLNFWGLPDFAKGRLVHSLREHGLAVDFQKLQLRGLREWIAENVTVASATNSTAPVFSVPQAELRFKNVPGKLFAWEMDDLILEQAQLIWPTLDPNEPAHQLLATNLTTHLRYLPGDQIELLQTGQFKNANLRLSATITNASALREWKRKPAGQANTNWQSQLHQLLRQLEFGEASKLRIRIAGDAAHRDQMRSEIRLEAPAIRTEHALANAVYLELALKPSTNLTNVLRGELQLAMSSWTNRATTARALRITNEFQIDAVHNDFLRADWFGSLGELQVRGASAKQLAINGSHTSQFSDRSALESSLRLAVETLTTEWGETPQAIVKVHCRHSWKDLIPKRADVELDISQPETRWAEADTAHVTAVVAARDQAVQPSAIPSWGPWSALAPIELSWTVRVDKLQSPRIIVDRLTGSGHWLGPDFKMDRLEANLYGGSISSSLHLDVGTRWVDGHTDVHFDLHRLELLTDRAENWLEKYGWQQPPKASAEVRVRLPVWTNAQPDWRAEVLPTLQLNGEFALADATFRDIPFRSARSHFTLENHIWTLPDLRLERPEGEAVLAYTSDMRTRDYHFKIQSRFDPRLVKPLLKPKEQKGLDYFELTGPPLIEGDLWGRWGSPELTGFKGMVQLTNFVFREEAFDYVHAGIAYTNRVFAFNQVNIQRGNQSITAPAASYDTQSYLLYLTNAVSTFNP
ncbi:MAG: hypothetical protein AB1813_27700, partial [Verrucomicrobiota bacterium]